MPSHRGKTKQNKQNKKIPTNNWILSGQPAVRMAGPEKPEKNISQFGQSKWPPHITSPIAIHASAKKMVAWVCGTLTENVLAAHRKGGRGGGGGKKGGKGRIKFVRSVGLQKSALSAR